MNRRSLVLSILFILLLISLFDPPKAAFAVSETVAQVNAQNTVPTIVNTTALPDPVVLLEGCGTTEAINVNVTCRFVVNDNNGAGDINVNVAPLNATVEFFDNISSAWKNGAGPYDSNQNFNASSANGLVHNCTWGAGWDTDGDGIQTAKNLTCNISLYFWTNASTAMPAAKDGWNCTGMAWDASNAQTNLGTNGTNVAQLVSLNILTNPINYGNVVVGADSAEKLARVNDTGNIMLDYAVNGSNMTGAGLIMVGNENYFHNGTGLWVNLTDDNPANDILPVKATKPTSIIGWVNSTGWRVTVPVGSAVGAYEGDIWMIATAG